MLKFLAKYNKIILAIGGTLLMIAFLIPQALQSLSDPRGRPVARIDGKEITLGELQRATEEVQILKAIGDEPLVSLLLQIEDPEHWLLLTREADRAGFVGGPQDGRNFLRNAAQMFGGLALREASARGQRFDLEQVPELVRQTTLILDQKRINLVNEGRPEPVIDLTLAKAAGVIRMYDLYTGASQLSTQEAQAMARHFVDQARIEYAVIPASRLAYEQPEPTEEQIKAHFEEFKSIPPGEGEHGFGLREPARVRVEWIALDRAPVEDSIKVDAVEVYRTWQEGRRQTPPRYETDFADSRVAVESELRQRAADRAMTEALRMVQAEIEKVERTLAVDGRYRVIPDDWESRRPDYKAIAVLVNERMKDRHGVATDMATAMSFPLVSKSAAPAALPGIGVADLQIGPRRARFDDVIFSVRELDPASPFALQTGVTAGPAFTGLPQRPTAHYFFRVLDARPPAPPDSFELVRGVIVENLKNLSAFEQLKGKADSIRQAAAADFVAAARDNGAVVRPAVNVRASAMMTLDQQPVDASINNKPVCESIMAQVLGLDPTVDPAQWDALSRTLTVPLPRSLSLLLARVVLVEPISTEYFRRFEPTIEQQAELERAAVIEAFPYTKARLAERHKFEYVRAANEETPPTGAVVPGDDKKPS